MIAGAGVADRHGMPRPDLREARVGERAGPVGGDVVVRWRCRLI